MKWEYRSDLFTIGANGSGEIDFCTGGLRQLGEQGWEVCGFTEAPTMIRTYLFFLKRPIA